MDLLWTFRGPLRRASRDGRSASPPAGTEPAGLRVDPAARRVYTGGYELQLSSKEFDVLALLAREPGTVVSRETLIAEVWDENWFGSTKTLDVTVGRLRQKLADAEAEERVVAVRGVGFRLET